MGHLFKAIDGPTVGPKRKTVGPLGLLLSDRKQVCSRPISENRIKVPAPYLNELEENFDLDYLNHDQRFLFKLSKAVATGNLKIPYKYFWWSGSDTLYSNPKN